MFTIEQIQKSRSKVKSGADFPLFINDLKGLGILYYETFVADGHTCYYGAEDDVVLSGPTHVPRQIADFSDRASFQKALLEHQQGKTDYATFLRMCATLGINMWSVSIVKMRCIYYDKVGTIVLTENIAPAS